MAEVAESVSGVKSGLEDVFFMDLGTKVSRMQWALVPPNPKLTRGYKPDMKHSKVLSTYLLTLALLTSLPLVGHAVGVVGISRCLKNGATFGLKLSKWRLGGTIPCFKARDVLITLANPAVPSLWPTTVLIDPTSSFSEDIVARDPAGNSALEIASASCGSPAWVPVPWA